MDFDNIDTYILDLDSTIWYWTKLIPGAKKVLKKLRRLKKKILFVTNNTIESRRGIADRLRKFGIEVSFNEVINAGIVIGYYIKERNGTALALNIGTEIDLRDAGVKVKEEPPVDFVVVTEDWDFDHEQLSLATDAVERGGKLLTSIMGRRWTVGNRMIPGVGCWVKAVEFAANTRAKCLGKPTSYMRKIVLRYLDNPKKSVFVGDEVKIDIEFAKKIGCKTVFVETGTEKKMKGKVKADLILNSIKDLLNYI
jgi:HAD superfamily hydrolase (TIGR01450 family)